MKKELKALTDEDIAACEPEAIWLETKKIPLPMHIVYWLFLLMLICGGLWATYARIDMVVVAEGRLTTNRPNITLSPLENSLIERVLVQAGQAVKKGDTLILFDTTINQSKLEEQQALYDSKLCEVLRLKAEKEGETSFALPDSIKDQKNATQQQLIFQARQEYYDGKILYFARYMQRYEKMASSLEESLEMYQDRQQKMKRIEDMYQKLAESDSIPTKDYLEVQMQRAANEIEIENQRANLVSYKEMIKQCEAEKTVFIAEWQQDISTKLVEAERELLSHQDGIKTYDLLHRQNKLLAPCDAVVHEISPYQEGAGVREAEALITLVPADSQIEAEIDIQAQDIGRVEVGDEMRIKLDAFPFQQHGTLTGQIRVISADTHQSQSNADQLESNKLAAGNNPRPQFRARALVEGELNKIPVENWNSAGMKLRAEIKVGERSVMEYLLNPFLKSLDESIREP